MTSGHAGAAPGDAEEPPGLAAERTHLARVRTVVALLLTSVIVAKATVPVQPAAALVCLGVATVAAVVLRLRPPISSVMLVGCVVALAAVGLVAGRL